ncbi:unnamed protein product, partial [marine sediment metagenome]
KQFSPLSVSEQVISILAGSAGLVDEIEVSEVGHFINELLAWLKLEAAEYLEELDEKGEITDELVENIKEAIKAYTTIYKFSFGI